MNGLLTVANLLACTSIVLQLIAYRSHGARYHPTSSLLAYVLIVVNGSVVIRTLMGLYPIPHFAEVVINALAAMFVIAVRGNVRMLTKPIMRPVSK